MISLQLDLDYLNEYEDKNLYTGLYQVNVENLLFFDTIQYKKKAVIS